MSNRYSKIAAEKKPELAQAELERKEIVDRRTLLQQKLNMLPANATKQREIIGREIFELNLKLHTLKSSKLNRGKIINDHFRSICQEYFPANVISQILDEANHRASGASPNKVELNLYNKIEVDIITNKYPALLKELEELKKKRIDLLRFLTSETPDLRSFVEEHEYKIRVDKTRFISKILNLLK